MKGLLDFALYNLAGSLIAGLLAWMMVMAALRLLSVRTPFLYASFLALPLVKSGLVLLGIGLVFPWGDSLPGSSARFRLAASCRLSCSGLGWHWLLTTGWLPAPAPMFCGMPRRHGPPGRPAAGRVGSHRAGLSTDVLLRSGSGVCALPTRSRPIRACWYRTGCARRRHWSRAARRSSFFQKLW